MAVEVVKSGDRQLVAFTWDKEQVTGEVVQFRCVNPDNGDVSVSGVSANDGQGAVSYPLGYSGVTHVTVYDNDGNTDEGFIFAGDAQPPDPPIDVPPIEEIPELPDHIWGPNDPRPTPPIAGVPGIDTDDDFWTGNLPPSEKPPDEFPVPNE